MNIQYLRECRQHIGYTRRQISEILNISYDMYVSIECGRRNCSVSILINLCKALDMDANILLGLK